MDSDKDARAGLFAPQKGFLARPGERSVLQGTVTRITYQNPSGRYTVARLAVEGSAGVTVVGEIFPVSEGEELRVGGLWKNHPRYGLQLQVEEFERLDPGTLEGIERYLGSGLIQGLGPSFARRLVSTFGLETLRVLSREPHRLLDVQGIGKVRARRIIQAWEKQRGIQDAMVFLQGHGVGSGLALKIYRVFGSETVSKVKENPYRLSREVYGMGFVLADRVACGLGIQGDSPVRVQAGTLHVLGKFSQEGHCFVPLDLLRRGVCSLIGVDEAASETAVQQLAQEKEVVVEDRGGGEARRVYPYALCQAEDRVSRALRRLLSTPSPLSLPEILDRVRTRADLPLEEGQREAVAQALRHKVLVITGGPGTGKTTLLTHLLTLFRSGSISFALAAPTGRAAKRMHEMTGVEAKTIHRLLEYNPHNGGFQRGEANPLKAEVLILDEASMLDLPLMDHLLRAVPAQSHLILIGDVDQLAPVGPGNVLRDLIESRVVPVVVLRHVYRRGRGSLISVNAHRILKGEALLLGREEEKPDFVYLARESQEEILETLKEWVKDRIPGRLRSGSVDGVQVLSPTNRGLLGTVQLNRELQDLLNPDGEPLEQGGRVFRLGDRVMQLRNNYDKGTFNGDLGRIEQVDRESGKIRVRFDGGSTAYDLHELDEISLAYATSVHKSQGSEYPGIVIPLHTTHFPMLHRAILYTAVTRGRELVVLVGSRKALSMAVGNLRVEKRFTALKEKLERARAGVSSAGS